MTIREARARALEILTKGFPAAWVYDPRTGRLTLRAVVCRNRVATEILRAWAEGKRAG